MPNRSEVRFQTKRDTGVYAMRSSDVPVQANQRRRNYGGGPHLFKKTKLESASREGPDIGPICHGRGNRSNKIPWTWHQGQLSRSLTLSSALTWAGGVITFKVRTWYVFFLRFQVFLSIFLKVDLYFKFSSSHDTNRRIAGSEPRKPQSPSWSVPTTIQPSVHSRQGKLKPLIIDHPCSSR